MAVIVLYNPNHAVVPNRVTRYLYSANTPEYDNVVDKLVNPSLVNVGGVPIRYWKVDTGSVVEMSSEEKTAIYRSTTQGEELIEVNEYSNSNKLEKQTWYSIDNEDGTYDGKSREITYTYHSNKLKSRVEKIFLLDGSEISSQQYDYYEQKKPKMLLIIKKIQEKLCQLKHKDRL